MLDPIELCRWQAILFADPPARHEILALEPGAGLAPLTIRVHRNHAFEPVAPLLRVYLAHAGFDSRFVYSDYDDALSFELHGDADVELLWIDDSRYRLDDGGLGVWLGERLASLRSRVGGPIAVPASLDRPGLNLELERLSIAGVHVLPLDGVLDAGPVFDERRAAVMGTRLNDRGQVLTARALGAGLPGLVLPRWKAVAVDLDNTLYDGVIAEDGIDGVVAQPDHLALQRRLVELRERGVLLAVVSRNDPADVERLFALRTDFALGAELIDSWQVGWGSKADAIDSAARSFAISPDAFVLIDDNPGELMAVNSALPRTGLIHAGGSARQTALATRFFPRLMPHGADEADVLRGADIRVRRQREREQRDADDPLAYLASLGVVVEFERNAAHRRRRLAELSRKTNQFNLSLARVDEPTVERYLSAADRDAYTVSMRDRLSDSGVIAGVLTHTEGRVVHVDEVTVSCRALGRGVEDVLIGAVLLDAAGDDGEEIVFHVARGERNAPARAWLERFSGQELGDDGRVTVAVDRTGLRSRVEAAPVTRVWIPATEGEEE